MGSLEKQMEELKISVNERLNAVESRMDATDIRISKLEDLLKKGGAGKDMEEIRQMFETLEKDTSKSKGKPTGLIDYDRQCTMVCGGLKSLSKDDAEQWVYDKLWSMYGPKPKKIYSKGEFRGLLFAQFYTPEECDGAIELFKNSGFQQGGKTIWANPDRKIEERVIRTLVFGTKRLVDQSLWADPESGQVTVGKEIILTGRVVDKQLQIEYGAGWKEYLYNPKHPEFKDLVHSLNEKLDEGTKKGSKTSGKFAGKGY